MPNARYEVAADNVSIFQEFLGEAPPLLEAMEGAFLQLAQGAPTKEPIEVAMRCLHTLKGIFGFLGLEGMNQLCHQAESAIEPYQNGRGIPSTPAIQWLLSALDVLRAQVASIAQGLSSGTFDLQDTAHLGLAPLPGVVESAEAPTAENARPEAAEVAQDRFIRIRVEKMDALLELVGEIAICQSQVGEGLRSVELAPGLASEVGRLAKISRELQETVLSLRLVPVEPLMLRASRVAYDVAQKTGKSLEFLSDGKETELDKRMVEELAEPLLHLVRNAVDHGLEDSARREAAGKPATGRLQLRASHQGGDFLLELEDDGQGLDLARLAEKGRSLGLLQLGEEQDDARVTQLIFEPGFSTASEITDISGRGVGLDAVRSRIHSLKGDIQVSSQPGLGCRFSIRLPLTMALVEGVLVRAGEQRYVVPAGQVRKFVAVDSSHLHRVGLQRGWMEAHGQSLPMIDLGRYFGQAKSQASRQVALHLESLGRQAMLVVDEVLGKQQVVAKSLGSGLQKMEGVAGGAILGDGKVSLILDIEALMGKEHGRGFAFDDADEMPLTPALIPSVIEIPDAEPEFVPPVAEIEVPRPAPAPLPTKTAPKPLPAVRAAFVPPVAPKKARAFRPPAPLPAGPDDVLPLGLDELKNF